MLLHIHCLALALAVLLPRCNGASAEQGVDADKLQPVSTAFFETAYYPQWQDADARREDERGRLFGRIDRDSAQWDSKHPRWKLLEALHGFHRYKDITIAEIDRFEGLYKHVPRNHKKVGTLSLWRNLS